MVRFRCDAGAYDEGLPGNCPSSPQAGCTNVTGVTFSLRDKNADGAGDGDKLLWKWREEASTDMTDLGDPTSATDFSVCVYQGVASVPALSATIPAASLCDGEDCWRSTGDHGFKFSDCDSTIDGIRTLKLNADAVPGAGKASLKGSGAGLAYSGLPLALDVTVQLIRGDSAVCWQSIHTSDTVRENSSEAFRSKIP